MSPERLLVVTAVGLLTGVLASRLVTGRGPGVVGDIVVGITGALLSAVSLGAYIAAGVLVPLGIVAGSMFGQVTVAFIGAVILLAALRVLADTGAGRFLT
jgi:uncharacterized membrane protein YeaQ/YmgE (transglycosylase-associated protein family)